VEVEGTIVRLGVGCGWLQGGKKGIGGTAKAKGIEVKEMLTDTINVICLLPHETDSLLYCPFVPFIFSPPDLHGIRVGKKLRNCLKREGVEGHLLQVDGVLAS